MKFSNVDELVKFATSGTKVPAWQAELFKQYREEVQVHSRGELFYKVDRLFPNEHPVSKAHRVLSFESITKGSFWKGVTNISRVFHNSSYSVEASENTGAFIRQNIFEKKNLFSFFLEKWCNNAIAEDPNARVAVYPFEFMKNKQFNQVVFVPSANLNFVDNETVIFISDDESTKKITLSEGVQTRVVYDEFIDGLNIVPGNKNTFAKKVQTEYTKKILHVFTDEAFCKITPTEQSDVFEWEIYPFRSQFMPCFAAGGQDVGRGIYQSFFSVFCPFGNLALLQHSQHTAVNFMFSFPRMSEIETPCDAHNCNGGQVPCPISDQHPTGKKTCSNCNGHGYTTNQSVYKVYKRRFEPNTLDETNVKVLDIDDVKFYTPDSTILDYSKSEWKDYLEMAEKAVYVPQKVETGNVESAKSKEVDLDDRYNFLTTIANVFYDRLRMVIQSFENYLNARPLSVVVNIPYSFAIESELEAFQALQLILTSPAPTFIKANKIETFINRFVSQSSPVVRFFSILKQVDLLLFYSDSEIAVQKIGGVVTVQQWAIHVYAFPVLFQMYYLDKQLFTLQDDAVIAKLTVELEKYKPDENMLKAKLIQDLNNQQ